MELYGTKREHSAEVAISQRENAIRRPTSLHRKLLTLDEYFGARMISDPLCLYDYTLESDGAVAAVVTSAARARGLRHRPVYVMGSAHGGMGRSGPRAPARACWRTSRTVIPTGSRSATGYASGSSG